MSAYPILYSFRRCPYAMRARLALLVSDRVCELREVVLRDKPPDMLAASAKGTVPVLVNLDGQVLDESIDIMLWALNQHDPEGWLRPELDDLQTMLDLIAQFDQEFKYHLDRYKYAERYPGANPQTHRAAGAGYLARLNDQLSTRCTTFLNHPHPNPSPIRGEGLKAGSVPLLPLWEKGLGDEGCFKVEHRVLSETRYLFGDRISLADMAIAPFVRQFAYTDQTWFNQQPWLQLQTWLDRLIESEIYSQAMQKYPKWESNQAGVRFPAVPETKPGSPFSP